MTEPKNPGCKSCEYYYFNASPVGCPGAYLPTPPNHIYHRCYCPELLKTSYSFLNGEHYVTTKCETYNSFGFCKHFKLIKPNTGIKCKTSWWKRLFGCGG